MTAKVRTALLALALSCIALTATAQPRLNQTSEFIWSLDHIWFGSFSGLEVSADSQTMVLVTDKGMLVQAVIRRRAGKLTAVKLLSAKPLKDGDGTPLWGASTDAEGFAAGADGAIFISFERNHRVAKLDPVTLRTERMTQNPAFETLDLNGSLEAWAVYPNGSLYTLPEQLIDGAKSFPLWRLQDGSWRIAHTIPARGRFLPVGADFDPQGRLYVLERSVTPLGFRSRIRRFTLPADVLREETLLTTLPGKFDNLEALSLWRDSGGTLHLTMISDDNFLPIQRTQIVEYTLTE